LRLETVYVGINGYEEVKTMGKKGKGGEKDGLMVRGTLYTFRRRCGNRNCRCHKGELHESPALAYSVGGRMRILTLKPEDVPEVAEALSRYKEERDALEARALAGIETLRAMLAERRGGGR
jgi:hypothetical protein